MAAIVNTGSTLTVTNGAGLSIGSDSTVAFGGLLDGSGNIDGGFLLSNLGTISAHTAGADLRLGTGTLTNLGTVIASNASLTVEASVNATNLVGGTLTGGSWEALGAGALVLLTGQVTTDDATITLSGTASTFDGFDAGNGTLQSIDRSLITVGTAGVLNLLSGRNFQARDLLIVLGTVTLDGGTLAVPTNGLTVGATGNVVGAGAIDPGTVVDAIGTIEARGGTLTVPQAANLNGSGTLLVDAGASLALQAFGGSYSETIINNGTIDAEFALLTGTLAMTGSYSGSGGFLIKGDPNGIGRTILELPSGLSANVAFDANSGALLLDGPSTYHGTIAGFGDNSRIVMPTVAGARSAALSGDNLLLKDSGGSVVQTITLDVGATDYSSATFTVTENGGDTQATLTVTGAQQTACFVAGTMIRTEAGEVPVERLIAGDVLHARFAGMAPVVWIGHRHIDCRRHPEPSLVWPIRVSAHAFGPRMPTRDLVLSPDHAVFVDDVLIPIRHLINDKTIVQEQVGAVTYYHVELAEHDVLIAEGMPAESYLENGNRGVFDNAGGAIALHPDLGTRRWEAFGCAPLVVTGAIFDEVVARVTARVPKEQGGNENRCRVA